MQEKKPDDFIQPEIKMVDIKKIKPYINNPRNNSKAVKPVMESIKNFGFNVPITVDKNYIIATGHTRYEAAKKLGLKEIPVIVLSELTPDQIKAWRLVDNKTAEYAEWDLDALAKELLEVEMDLSSFNFEVPGSIESVVEDDYDPDPPTMPIAREGDVYKLGRHLLICGDSTDPDTFKGIVDPQSIDLLVTDPPYNVNYAAPKHKQDGSETKDRRILNDNMDNDQFYSFLYDLFTQAYNLLKQGGGFYIFHADSMGAIFRNAAEDSNLPVRQCLIWKKNSLVLGRQDYQWIHEPVLYGWKEGAAHFFIDDRGYTTYLNEEENDLKNKTKGELMTLIKEMRQGAYPTTILEEARPSKNAEHPTMKPIRLIARLIANSSKEGQCILDICGGSGSTLIAAEQMKRNAIVVELDPKYVDVIIDRYQRFTLNRAIKIRDKNGPIKTEIEAEADDGFWG